MYKKTDVFLSVILVILVFYLIKLGFFDFTIGDVDISFKTYAYTWHIISSLFGFICITMAKARGRNQLLGFIGGYIFEFFAVIYYLLVGDTTEVRVHKEEWAREAFRNNSKGGGINV